MMVIKLNMILITSPELADFRRRLKNLETKVRSTLTLATLNSSATTYSSLKEIKAFLGGGFFTK